MDVLIVWFLNRFNYIIIALKYINNCSSFSCNFKKKATDRYQRVIETYKSSQEKLTISWPKKRNDGMWHNRIDWIWSIRSCKVWKIDIELTVLNILFNRGTIVTIAYDRYDRLRFEIRKYNWLSWLYWSIVAQWYRLNTFDTIVPYLK